MKRGLERSETVAGLREESGSRSRSGSDENSKNYQNDLRADTRTPGLSRKSNSTLALANDVDMEVASSPWHCFGNSIQERIRELEEMLQGQKR